MSDFSRINPKTQVLIALAIIHALVSLYAVVPGYLLIDEAIYHWMQRDFLAMRSVELWNGYGRNPIR